MKTLLASLLIASLQLTAANAVDSQHWSFQPVVRPPVPAEGSGNNIDRFVRQGLKRHSLNPSPRADRRTLIRRLYLVMHGLPPSPQQVDAFIADADPAAWPKLVDRVLASPRFGERWARHWLDVVRFAETNGFETNRERTTAYHFRDYVIAAFNQDKPYDQFVREQIAGDHYGAPVGTGFLVAGPHDIVKSPDPQLTLTQRQDELADMINTTGTAFLGLTLGCARCHDHKFDPVPLQDYYQMQAVFAGVRHGEGTLPTVATDEGQQKLPPVSAAGNVEKFEPIIAKFIRFTITATSHGEPCIDELEVFNSASENVALASNGTQFQVSSNLPGYAIHQPEHLIDGKHGNDFSWISNEPGKGVVRLEFPKAERIERIRWARDGSGRISDRLATGYHIEASADGKNWTEIANSSARRSTAATHKGWIGTFAQPGATHVLHRGDPFEKREVVNPDALAVFGSLGLGADSAEKTRRQRLAEWITETGQPLTSRVMANRLWQYTFGVGLVDTPSDFGGNGNAPTHPELLDWLAAEFVAQDWSVKHLLRLMLTSDTFQQSSAPNPDAHARDADGRLLWRFTPRRLEAEGIRDSILSATGSLDLTMGGPGFYLLDVDRENVHHYHPKQETGPTEWRRMVYMFKVRQEQDAVFGAFDCPDGNQVIPKRSRSTTPLQALNLFNSRFVMQQAEILAKFVEQAGVDAAYRRLYGRSANPGERHDAEALVRDHGAVAFSRALLNSNEFLFIP